MSESKTPSFQEDYRKYKLECIINIANDGKMHIFNHTCFKFDNCMVIEPGSKKRLYEFH